MIPHHENAINMGKSLLKLHDERIVAVVEGDRLRAAVEEDNHLKQ